jgi:sulfite exporter TauE/SafE
MILPALALGFAGSLHCVGMCGPIAMSIPVGRGNALQQSLSIAFYHIGRLSSYALLGFAFGLLGYGLDFAGFQQTLSLALGIFMLAFIWLPRFAGRIGFGSSVAMLQSRVTGFIAKYLKSHRPAALLGLGFFNGLLPCGLVYVAIAASMAQFHPLNGAAFMVFFGLGTVPTLLGVAISGKTMSLSFRSQLRKVAPILVTVFAVVLILRGLGLGIPYLSPELSPVVSNVQECAP